MSQSLYAESILLTKYNANVAEDWSVQGAIVYDRHVLLNYEISSWLITSDLLFLLRLFFASYILLGKFG